MWTKEQLEIIKTRGKNLIISASAGSGKTSVLIERVFNLILKDKINLEKIVMITFTKKAAQEMKEKLKKKIIKFLSTNSKNNFLIEQLEYIEKSNISTIHSFCKNIIEENFQKIEIDLNFRILNQAETNKIINDILTNVFEKEYNKKNSFFLKLLETYSNLESDNELKNIIKNIYFITRSIPDYKKWMINKINYFTYDENKFIKNNLGKYFIFFIKKELKNFNTLIKKQFLLSQKKTIEYKDIFEKDKNIFIELNNKFKYKNWIEFFNITKSIFSKLPYVKEEKQNIEYIKFKKIRNLYKSKLKELSFDLEYQLKILNSIKSEIKYLINIVYIFEKEYTEYKKKNNFLDFNDLENLTIELFKDNKIVNYYKKQFEYIFVDEFQDINIIQEKIIKKISSKNNLFIVGDLKQSIYRFRLSNSNIFFKIFKKYKKEKNSKAFNLNKNFRSSFKIVEAVNSLFEKLMDGKKTKLKYKDTEKLIYSSDVKNKKKIDIIIINKKNDDNNLKISSDDKIYNEAYISAKKIKNLIRSNIKINSKKLEYNDFVILMYSTKKAFPIYKEVFDKYNIPIFAETDDSFFSSNSIILLIDLLKIINNKENDLALINILKSKLFNFNLQELSKIRLSEIRKKSFSKSFFSYKDEENLLLYKKVKNFLEILEKLKNQLKYISLSEFVYYLINEINLIYLYFSEINGEKEISNIKEFLYLVEEYEKKYQDNLLGFLDYFDIMETESINSGKKNIFLNKKNAVTLLTLHKSKGLEFPIVFLSNLGSPLKYINKNQILLHPELGIGPAYMNNKKIIKTIAYHIINKKIEEESFEDNLNLLYVGMTRAKDYLFLIGVVNDLKNKKKYWKYFQNNDYYINEINYKIKSFFDLILPLCFFNKNIKKYFNIKEKEFNIEKQKEEKQKEEKQKEEKQKEEKQKEEKQKEEKQKEEKQIEKNKKIIINNNSFIKIPNLIPRKISVTEFCKNKDDYILSKDFFKNDLKIKPDFLNKNLINPLEKGILFHFIMENIDYFKIKNKKDVEIYFQKLISRKILSNEELRNIKLDEVVFFIESFLGERIRKSLYFEKEQAFNYLLNPKIVCKEYNEKDSILLQGIIDLYFKESDGYVIIDFKTDCLKEEKIYSKIDEYKKQIFLYSKALEEIKKEKVKEKYIYFSFLKKIILIEGI